MINLLKNKTYPIGMDMTDDVIRLAQLANSSKGISLLAGALINRPANIKPESKEWQTWAADSIFAAIQNGKFKGKEIVAAIPANQVFVDYIKVAHTNNTNLDDAVFSKIKQKLPFDPDKTIIKYVTTENDSVLVVASKKEIIDKHLQIFEMANLQVKAINIWPAALTNCYTRFFGRRKTDLQSIVILIDIEPHCSNVVICRSRKLLFACSIALGSKTLDSDDAVSKLVSELVSCKRYFCSLQKGTQIERLVFLSGNQPSDIRKDYCATIARKLNMPAQLGDCLAAVRMDNSYECGVDRRQRQYSWATAFGLSLS